MTTATFPELGGDSMMAIDATHRILKATKSSVSLSPDQIITPNDLFQNSIQSLYNLVINGRSMMVPRTKSAKRSRSVREADNDKKLALHHLPDVTVYNGNSSIGDKIKLAWKLPLQMCVDARPIILPTFLEGSDMVAVGSQGGDFVVADRTTGQTQCRMQVNGKIEGEMSFLEIESETYDGIKCILYVCSYDVKYSNDGLQRLGYVNAFSLGLHGRTNDPNGVSKMKSLLSRKRDTHNREVYNELPKLWEYEMSGELKNKPIAFSVPQLRGNVCYRVVVGSYNGTVSYLDAITGKVLDTIKNDCLGGAIHADPIVTMTEKEEMKAKVIVASSTWTGKVSCLCVKEELGEGEE